MDTPTLTIQKSTDYDQFLRISGNRNENRKHIDNIKAAYAANPACAEYDPILVNEKYEIIDGQHRYQASKELGLPIYYMLHQGLGLKTVQQLNSASKVWGPVDFARSYAELGNVNYQTYLDFKKRWHFSHEVLLRALILTKVLPTEAFRAGRLIVENETLSNDYCLKLSELGTFLPQRQHKLRAFAFAFMIMWQNESYDHDRMMLKMAQRARTIEHRALTEDYARDLEAIYNYGVSAENRVRFF